MAMIQPKAVRPEPTPPPPEEPPEEDESADAGADDGTTGTEGGVVGGVPGGVPHGGGGGSQDTPTYAAPGYRKPELAVRDCLKNAIHIPRDLQNSISRPVTVKFAIRKDGTPALFQVMTQLSDRRIGDVIWQAVASCHWVPGADPHGQPASIWVVVPFRFQSG